MTTPDPDDDARLEQRLHASRALVDAPEWLVQRVIDAGPAVSAPPPRRRLLARLSFDSGGLPAHAHGLRSTALAGSRQLLYSTDGRDIDVRVTPVEGSAAWRISGQVLGPDAAGTAELRAGDAVRSVPWNELCEFVFDGVPGEPCTLVLRGDDWEVELPPFGAPPQR